MVTALAQEFACGTGHSVKLEYGTAGALQKRAAGDAGDVVIVTAAGFEAPK
ncbi:MAG: hypothetical protein HY323_04175 [Betaproteobacteria bacterium]|nr:hypothetical protein [Betaproteobacteria bacterium]